MPKTSQPYSPQPFHFKVTNLVFEQIAPGKPSRGHCSACGKPIPTEGARSAGLKIPPADILLVLVCNEQCEKRLREHKNADRWLNMEISQLRKRRIKRLRNA